ncbi:hypothetical protein ACUXK4_001562 [Methylorubrum extorquens]
MSRNFDQAWEALVAHFGAEQVNGITSSRRQFGAHLLPDLQATVVARSPLCCWVCTKFTTNCR